MPVYAYACTACAHAFDFRQGFADAALTVCERCGGALRKQYGTVGVTFNGSGFYRTDSRAAEKASSDTATGKKSSGDKAAAGKTGATTPKRDSQQKPAATTSAAATGGASSAS